jgi:DNA-binding MarR family transcriptional regulator
MNGPELYRLGRRLIRLGVKAIPPGGFRELPTSVRMVLVDVIEHPDTTITQIVERTGFPQSHVSSAVARLRDAGVLTTAADPNDRRRTLVAPSQEHMTRVKEKNRDLEPIDPLIESALIDASTFSDENLREALAALEVLARLFDPPGHAPSHRSTHQPSHRELAASTKGTL